MKQLYLLLAGLSMILMSCENVQEKSELFKQEFDKAIKLQKYDDAERVANDAQAYYDGLSESNKKKYDECTPNLKIVLAAKKFNKRFQDAKVAVDAEKTMEFPACDKIAKEAKQYKEGLDKHEAEVFEAELTDFEAEIVKCHALFFMKNIFDAMLVGDEDTAKKLADLSDAYIPTLNNRLQEVYKNHMELVHKNLVSSMNQY